MDVIATQQVEAFARALLTVNGVGLAIGVVLSLVIVYFPEYDNLSPRSKRYIFLGLALLLPIVGMMLGVLVLGWPFTFVEAIFPALSAGFAAAAAGTALHGRTLSKVRKV